jgi:hypothetical protein
MQLGDVKLTSPNNYRMIRYADVLLMAAEAQQNKVQWLMTQQLVISMKLERGLLEIMITTLQLQVLL